jgi:AraC-like DNA-binding protein
MLGAPTRQLFASRDLQETRSLVAKVMKPHQLGVVAAPGQRLDARMHHLSLGQVSLSRLCYGAEVDIEPGELDDFFLVMMPVRGHAQVHSGFDEVASSAEQASVVSPHLGTRMRWSADYDQLMVRLSRSFLERMLVAHMGRDLDAPLSFSLGFRWRDNPAWQCLMRYLVDWAEQPIQVTDHQLTVAHIEQLVASTLLTAQPHNYSHSETGRGRRSTVLPKHVKRVQAFLQAHAHEPVRAEQLADVAGVSLRSLYAGFQDFCGVSPMRYLRDLRLDRVRADLLTGMPTGGVSGVALRWGFAHMGRFSADYKARFGESPSQTIRRS